MKPSYEKAHLDTALDEAPDSFLFDLNWSAQELTDAMCRSLDSLDRFALALPGGGAEAGVCRLLEADEDTAGCVRNARGAGHSGLCGTSLGTRK